MTEWGVLMRQMGMLETQPETQDCEHPLQMVHKTVARASSSRRCSSSERVQGLELPVTQ